LGCRSRRWDRRAGGRRGSAHVHLGSAADRGRRAGPAGHRLTAVVSERPAVEALRRTRPRGGAAALTGGAAAAAGVGRRAGRSAGATVVRVGRQVDAGPIAKAIARRAADAEQRGAAPNERLRAVVRAAAQGGLTLLPVWLADAGVRRGNTDGEHGREDDQGNETVRMQTGHLKTSFVARPRPRTLRGGTRRTSASRRSSPDRQRRILIGAVV